MASSCIQTQMQTCSSVPRIIMEKLVIVSLRRIRMHSEHASNFPKYTADFKLGWSNSSLQTGSEIHQVVLAESEQTAHCSNKCFEHFFKKGQAGQVCFQKYEDLPSAGHSHFVQCKGKNHTAQIIGLVNLDKKLSVTSKVTDICFLLTRGSI